VTPVIPVPGCSFTSPNLDYQYDLSGLYAPPGLENSDFISNSVDNYTFHMTVCGAAKDSSVECTEAGGSVCGYGIDDIFINAMGFFDLDVMDGYEWFQLDPSKPMAGAGIRYNNGYFINPDDPVTITVEFPCDESVTEVQPVFDVTDITHNFDSFYFQFPATKWACPTYIPPLIIHTPDEISAGWIFIIVLLLGGFFYLVVGTLYKTMNRGLSGVESIPNIDFWQSLPGLVRDGCKATQNKFCGGRVENYNEL
jgi:hypothetical protein